MTCIRNFVGPSWPPGHDSYGYVLSLSPSDLAWEFLRRSPAYQRDYQLNRKGISVVPHRPRGGKQFVMVRRRSRSATSWGLSFFADPVLAAPNSPVCWCSSPAAPLIDTIVQRTSDKTTPDLWIDNVATIRHVVLGPGNEQLVLIKDAVFAVALRLHGCRASLAPVNTSFLYRGLPDPDSIARSLSGLIRLIHHPDYRAHKDREHLFLRDALVALDGNSLGASYREIATIIYGPDATRAAWVSASRWMKDRVRRALAKGELLRDGAYRELLR